MNKGDILFVLGLIFLLGLPLGGLVGRVKDIRIGMVMMGVAGVLVVLGMVYPS